MPKNTLSDLISGTSEWLALKDLPSTSTAGWRALSAAGKIGVYIVALRNDIEEIDNNNFICSKVGYIGKSSDIVTRTSNIRATVKSSKQSYHNCGSYIKKRLDQISLDQYVVKYLYTKTEEDNTRLESEYHRVMTENFGAPFAWREASGGKDGRLERIASDLEILTDDEKLKAYELLYTEIPKILMRRYHDEILSREDE
jgi:hypothetical protein